MPTAKGKTHGFYGNGFTGAGFAHQTQGFSGFHREVNAVYRADVAFFGLEMNRKIFNI